MPLNNTFKTVIPNTSGLMDCFVRALGPITALALAASLSACGTTAIGPSKGAKVALAESGVYVNEFPEVDLNDIARSKTRDVFKVGDIAEVEVYDVETLSTTYVVDRNGSINFPLIGTVQVAGLSTADLQTILVERYGRDFLREPSVNVKLEAQTLGRVVVDGAVNKPTVFEVNDIISLSEAIAQAQGIDQESSNGSSIFIVRNIQGERRVRVVNLKDIRELGAPDPQIVPADVIFVQDNAGRVAFREFLKTLPIINTAVILTTRT